MADPVLGIGPNLNAYRAALQTQSQGQQMIHMARHVARTLNSAFQNVPFPTSTTNTRREKDVLRLREAIEQMVLALTATVKDGGFDGIEWPDAGGSNFTIPLPVDPQKRIADQLILSTRSLQLRESREEILEAMERSLHPLEDPKAAKQVAWLAQAQVLHEAILALNAQANIDRDLAEHVLEVSQPESIVKVLALRADAISKKEER